MEGGCAMWCVCLWHGDWARWWLQVVVAGGGSVPGSGYQYQVVVTNTR